MNKTVIVRGGGDIASGVIHRLFMSGFKVIVLEVEKPLSIRRTVSFSQAIYDGEVLVEGVTGGRAKNLEEIERIIRNNQVAIISDKNGDIINEIKPMAVIDAILAKKNLGTNKDMAPVTIGIGPGFNAGEDVDLVIESNRGHYLGRVIHKGRAIKDTSVPGNVMGYDTERVIRATSDGVVEALYEIGDRVEKGDVVCKVGDDLIKTEISGILRGMIMDGISVKEGLKIGDVDPRGIKDHAFTISDKARAIGGGVLEGILFLENKRLD